METSAQDKAEALNALTTALDAAESDLHRARDCYGAAIETDLDKPFLALFDAVSNLHDVAKLLATIVAPQAPAGRAA